MYALSPCPRIQHLGTAEAAEHPERWHHHDPDPPNHSLHHRAHLLATRQGAQRNWGSLGRLGGGHRADKTWAGSPSSQTLWLLSQDVPTASPVHWLTVHSFICSWRRLLPLPHPDPHPWPIRVHERRTLTLKTIFFHLPRPSHRMTARQGWRKIIPTR